MIVTKKGRLVGTRGLGGRGRRYMLRFEEEERGGGCKNGWMGTGLLALQLGVPRSSKVYENVLLCVGYLWPLGAFVILSARAKDRSLGPHSTR